MEKETYEVEVTAVVTVEDRSYEYAENQAENSIESVGSHDSHLEDVEIMESKPCSEA